MEIETETEMAMEMEMDTALLRLQVQHGWSSSPKALSFVVAPVDANLQWIMGASPCLDESSVRSLGFGRLAVLMAQKHVQ